MKSTHWLPIYGALLLTYFVENKGQRKVWGKSYWKSQRGSLFRTDTKQPLQTWPSIPAAVSFIPERLNGGYEKWRVAYISWPTRCNCHESSVPAATLSVAIWPKEARIGANTFCFLNCFSISILLFIQLWNQINFLHVLAQNVKSYQDTSPGDSSRAI